MKKNNIIFAIIVLIVFGLILTNNTSVAFAQFAGSILHFAIITALIFTAGYVILFFIGKFSK